MKLPCFRTDREPTATGSPFPPLGEGTIVAGAFPYVRGIDVAMSTGLEENWAGFQIKFQITLGSTDLHKVRDLGKVWVKCRKLGKVLGEENWVKFG